MSTTLIPEHETFRSQSAYYAWLKEKGLPIPITSAPSPEETLKTIGDYQAAPVTGAEYVAIKKAVPKEATITKVTKTPEGYQIQYAVPIPKPKPQPTRPPPATWQAWLGRAGEGITEPFRQAFFPTPREQMEKLFPFKARPLYTTTLIQRTEQAQAWLREAPIKEQLIFTPMGKPEFKKPIVETLAQALEYAYIPIGAVRAVEMPIYIAPTIVSGVAAIGRGEVTLETIKKGVGEWVETVKKQPITLITTFAPEQAFKHPGLIAGELVGSFVMGKYVYGPAIGKAWRGIKKGAGVVYRKTPLYERALYKRVTTPLPLAKELIPEEQAFKVLTKTKAGWQYKPLTTTQRVITETGKKTTWKPTLWKKPVGFKPTPAKWYPPAPMKATILRELPKVIPSGKGMALITKQVTKQAPKVVLKQAVSPIFAKPLVKTALLATLVVPSLVKPRMKPFPSIYKQKKEIFAVSMARLAPYPEEKPKKKEKVAPISLLKTWELERLDQPQLPKIGEIQLPKEAQILRQPQLGKQVQKQWEQQVQALEVMQIQIQKQPSMMRYRFRLEEVFGKRKRGLLEEEKWWFRKHPIPTPKSVMQTLFIGKTRKKKKRRKRKR